MFGFGLSGDPCRAWHKFQQLRDSPANNPTPHRHKMSAAITDDGDDGKKRDWLGVEDSEGEEDAVSDEEEESRVKGISRATKRRKVDHASGDEDDSGGDEEEEAVGEIDEAPKAKKGKGNGRPKSKDSAENDDELLFTNPNKLKPLTQDELAASKLATSKTGVIYLSRIPVYPRLLQCPNRVINC